MLSTHTPIWLANHLKYPDPTPTSDPEPAIHLQVRAIKYDLHPTVQVRLFDDTWMPAASLTTKHRPLIPTFRPKSSLLDRTPRHAAAFMDGLSQNKTKFLETGRQICRNVYGVAPDPAMDFEDHTLYGAWILGLSSAVPALPPEVTHLLRVGVPDRALDLMTIFGLEPTYWDVRRPCVSHNALVAIAGPNINYRASRKPSFKEIRRTNAPLTTYPPGTYTLPNLQIRIPE